MRVTIGDDLNGAVLERAEMGDGELTYLTVKARRYVTDGALPIRVEDHAATIVVNDDQAIYLARALMGAAGCPPAGPVTVRISD